MLILAVDTSSTTGSLALLRDATVLSHRVSSDEPYSSGLLRDTKELLEDSRISLQEIELFAVNAGPGSFTGLRVGLTTVKAWAEVWRRPIAAVSGLEAVAAQVLPSIGPGSTIASVMDARRGQVFGGVFRSRREDPGMFDRIGDEVVATAGEFLECVRQQLGEIGGGLRIACVSREVIEPELQRRGLDCCPVDVVSNVLAPFIGWLGYDKAIRGHVVDALHLDANYIRRSDAEMNWKEG